MIGYYWKVFFFSVLSYIVHGKTIQLKLEFDDLLKLVPIISKVQENLKKNVEQGLTSSSKAHEDSIFLRFDVPRRKYNNPYHPEDDLPERVIRDEEKLFDHSKINNKYEKISSNLIKSNLDRVSDNELNKENEQYFIKKKYVISEDELTDIVKEKVGPESDLSLETVTIDLKNLKKKRSTVKTGNKTGNTTQATSENARSNDSDGFRLMQRRFIKANRTAPPHRIPLDLMIED